MGKSPKELAEDLDVQLQRAIEGAGPDEQTQLWMNVTAAFLMTSIADAVIEIEEKRGEIPELHIRQLLDPEDFDWMRNVNGSVELMGDVVRAKFTSAMRDIIEGKTPRPTEEEPAKKAPGGVPKKAAPKAKDTRLGEAIYAYGVDELVDKSGVSRPSIYRLIKAENKNVPRKLLSQIAGPLKVEESRLVVWWESARDTRG